MPRPPVFSALPRSAILGPSSLATPARSETSFLVSLLARRSLYGPAALRHPMCFSPRLSLNKCHVPSQFLGRCASSSGSASSGQPIPNRRLQEARTTYEGACDADAGARLGLQSGFSRANFIAQHEDQRRRKELEERYEIGERLGQGATATVYRAVSRKTGGAVALKVISKELVPQQSLLRNEIDIHKATDHPNILRLLRTFEDEKSTYLITEICEGGDLGQYLDNVGHEYGVLKMEEDDALQIFQQVVASVRYLHKVGIVHRDLKLGNFLCTAAWSSSQKHTIVKLTDFGVSAASGIKHLLTRRVGTDGYMAPEVLKCQPYNEKADIFSIGCILHTLLTGRPPKATEGGTFRTDKLRLKYVSDEMRGLIEWLTQALPDDRPSIEQVARSPLLLKSQLRLRESSDALGVQLLDKMYSYASFPLLKKAALVAMVSRAESDSDFLPCIEKFMSFGSHASMNYAISVSDVYEALLNELSNEMDVLVRRHVKIRSRKFRSRRSTLRRTSSGGPLCVTSNSPAALGSERFKQDLRAEVDELVRKIDCDGNGSISYSEWLAATVDEAWYTDPSRIAATFRRFDANGDGKISADDLLKVIPAVFSGVAVDSVLQESQLSAKPNSWLSEEHFSLLMRTGSLSTFTLQRMAEGNIEPLVVSSLSDLY